MGMASKDMGFIMVMDERGGLGAKGGGGRHCRVRMSILLPRTN